MLPAVENTFEAPIKLPVYFWDITWYKKRAKRLKKYLATLGIGIVHSHALEAVARIHGLSSYHELSAMIKRGKYPLEFSNVHLRFIKRAERLRSFLSAAGKEISQNQANEFIALAYRERESDPHSAESVMTETYRQGTSRKGSFSGSSSPVLVWTAQANGEK